MLGDNERTSAYTSEQRRLVRAAVAAEVLTFTPYWREVAGEVGLHRPSAPADLTVVPPRPLAALGAPESLVLRPTLEEMRKEGPRPLRRRLRRARLGRARAQAGRRILNPLYTPVHWIIEDETPVGCTEADLVRLAELGRRSLELAGVGANDAIVGLVPPGPSLPAWQLALGARDAGIPLAGLSPSTSLEAVAMLGPSVLAGRPVDLFRVLDGLSEEVCGKIGTVLTVTRAPLEPGDRRALAIAAGDQASVVEIWAPPGVRALWTQCRGGAGVHTWPQAELLEVCGPDGVAVAPGDEGELVWTGLGWRGTVLVRLATGMRGRLVEGRCDNCGRTTPRVVDAQPMAGSRRRPRRVAEREDEAGAVVGPIKATGGVESVRTVRTTRKSKAAARAAAKQEEQGVRAEGLRAEAKEEIGPVPAVDDDPPGSVRAMPKDESDDTFAAPGGDRGRPRPPREDRLPSAGGEVESLPPVPEVGPDAAAAAGAPAVDGPEPWLPDTGEVDAWPAPVLASVEGLAAWQVEHRRRRGHDELVVHLALAEGAELGEVLVSLERSIGATQYVVGDEAEIAARVAAADGRRVVDSRDRSRANGNGDGRPPAIASTRRSTRGA